jgi:trk system potassium uptake protein TrkH
VLVALGNILLIAAAVLCTPLAILPFYPEESALALDFILPGLALAAAGLLLVFIRRNHRGQLKIDEQEGAVVVTSGWLIVTAVSAWPFMRISGLDFSQAFFEAMSGWTTTGLSMIDVEHAPKLLLFFRSIIQLGGGAGLAIIMLAAFSLSIGAGLYRAEGRSYQLVPNVTRSAKLVVTLYLGYTIFGSIALSLSGMTPFDAVNHTFCAVSTGGFSTKATSIGYWDSPLLEAEIIILMILGNLNFLSAFVLFTGKVRSFFRNAETRLFSFFALSGIVMLYIFVANETYASSGKKIRVAIFEAVTALTTTGFSTVSYVDWNGTGILVIIVLMVIGGGICSTAGGLKQYRVFVLAKAVWWELRRMLLPRQAVVVHRAVVGDEDRIVTERQVMEIGVFVFLYIATLAIGTGVLTASGYALRDAFFEFASALGTVGLSVGVTATSTPVFALWTMTAGMFLGRLEFFVIFVSIARLLHSLRNSIRR